MFVRYLVTKSCLTLCDPMDCSIPGFPVLHDLLEFAQTHFYWVSDAIQPSCPLLFLSPPAFNLSQHQGQTHFRVWGQTQHQTHFWWVSPSNQEAKGLDFSISHSNEYSMLISFRIDLFYLFAVQGTLKSLLQHHDSKILWHSAFLMAQHSHRYMTTGETIALAIHAVVSKVMSLLFNTLSGFVTTVLPRKQESFNFN